jgi:hypothetical protein
VGALTSKNPVGLHVLLRGYLYFTLPLRNLISYIFFDVLKFAVRNRASAGGIKFMDVYVNVGCSVTGCV